MYRHFVSLAIFIFTLYFIFSPQLIISYLTNILNHFTFLKGKEHNYICYNYERGVFMLDIGKKIRNYRIDKDFSQKEISNMIKKPYNSVISIYNRAIKKVKKEVTNNVNG